MQRVEEYFKKYPNDSLRRASEALQISKISLYRILKYFLNFHRYKISVHQLLVNKAMARRVEFCQQFSLMSESRELAAENCIVFSDEAHFSLGGFVNEQNVRFCKTEPPHFIESKSLHPKKIIAWAAITAKGVLIEFFDSPIIKGEVYCQFLEKHFFPWTRKNKLIKNLHFAQMVRLHIGLLKCSKLFFQCTAIVSSVQVTLSSLH